MNILVTGATGFVGQRLVKRLTELGHEVHGTYEKEGPKDYRLLELADESSIKKAVDGSWQWVIHLAAVSGTKEANANPEKAWSVNVVGTRSLITALGKLRTRPSVLLVSSSDVYGEGGGRRSVETDRLAPRSLYAATKAAGELAATCAARETSTNLIIARPWPHTGPGQQGDRLLTRWMDELRAKDPRPRGDPRTVRDYMHVDDVVNAYCALVGTSPRGGIYNIASGKGENFGDLFAMVCEIMGVQSALIPYEAPSDAAMYSVGDPSKIQADTGWKPTKSAFVAIEALIKSRKHAETH
ncbi:MAG: NAD(P)-dependent oxidoreductase [Gemmatimonadota bacterium]